MTVAYEFNQPLSKVLSDYTELEIETCVAWLELRAAQPQPTDFYLMQVAAEVRKTFSSNAENIDLNQFRLKFDREETLPPTKKQREKHNRTLSEIIRGQLQSWVSSHKNNGKRQKRPPTDKG